MDYYTLLTNVGIAKFVAARASNAGVNLRSFKLSSKAITPTQDMSVLEEVVYERSITNKFVESNNPNHVIIECHIPSNVGGFEVNAIGVYDEEGDLIAIGNTPRTYKPLLSEGSAKELMIKVIMEVSNASEVILTLNPSIIMASRDYVDNAERKLTAKANEAIAEYTQRLALKADLNGSSQQVFNVAPPTEDNHAINKATLDERLNGIGGNMQDLLQNAVLLSNNQSISGVKTFSSNPICATNPTANNQLANKAYVDAVGNSKVALNGNQTINGVKTFSTAPMCGGIMSADNQLVNLATLKRAIGVRQSWKNKTFTSNVTYSNNGSIPIKIVLTLNNISPGTGKTTLAFFVNGAFVKELFVRPYVEFPYLYTTQYQVIIPARANYRFEVRDWDRRLTPFSHQWVAELRSKSSIYDLFVSRLNGGRHHHTAIWSVTRTSFSAQEFS